MILAPMTFMTSKMAARMAGESAAHSSTGSDKMSDVGAMTVGTVFPLSVAPLESTIKTLTVFLLHSASNSFSAVFGPIPLISSNSIALTIHANGTPSKWS